MGGRGRAHRAVADSWQEEVSWRQGSCSPLYSEVADQGLSTLLTFSLPVVCPLSVVFESWWALRTPGQAGRHGEHSGLWDVVSKPRVRPDPQKPALCAPKRGEGRPGQLLGEASLEARPGFATEHRPERGSAHSGRWPWGDCGTQSPRGTVVTCHVNHGRRRELRNEKKK